MHNPVCAPGTQASSRQSPLQGADGGTGLRMLLVRMLHIPETLNILPRKSQNERRLKFLSNSTKFTNTCSFLTMPFKKNQRVLYKMWDECTMVMVILKRLLLLHRRRRRRRHSILKQLLFKTKKLKNLYREFPTR